MFVFFFFFKQKTAYEVRISDWSSDVCSSDLWFLPAWLVWDRSGKNGISALLQAHRFFPQACSIWNSCAVVRIPCLSAPLSRKWLRSEERRVGKECVSSVDLGGRRIIKKKKKNSRGYSARLTNTKN